MKIVRFQAPGEASPRPGVLEGASIRSDDDTFELDSVRLMAPCQPTKIVCVGRNYADHAAELNHEIPKAPLLFFKPPSAVIGPGAPIRLPGSGEIHYEGELAVVVKARCRNLSPDEAGRMILGYTCMNDVTDRTAQAWETNWVRAKGFDTSAPLGPWIVTTDEVSPPFRVRLRLNGEVRQDASTDAFLFGIEGLISTISSVMTLEPGDVIATGTPAGVGVLTAGDVVEVEIDGVGVLTNPVRGEESNDA